MAKNAQAGNRVRKVVGFRLSHINSVNMKKGKTSELCCSIVTYLCDKQIAVAQTQGMGINFS